MRLYLLHTLHVGVLPATTLGYVFNTLYKFLE